MIDHQPPRTGFELTWKVLGIRIRVFPSFFVVSALIVGAIVWINVRPDPVTTAIIIAIDVACLFVGLLFVGLVQGLVYRSYGLRSTLVIRELIGGVYPEAEPPTVVQRIVVALAVPASAFLLFALVYFSNEHYEWRKTSAVADLSYFILYWVSLFWGVIGLLPVYPYSGGKILLEILSLASPHVGLALTLVISILVGIAYVAYTALVHTGQMNRIMLTPGHPLPASIIVAIFFALSVAQNWQLLQFVRAARRPSDPADDYDRSPWER